jgi:tetratricopeptide (TPR) repeat protein
MSFVKQLDRLFLTKGWALDRCTLARRVARVNPGWDWAHRSLASCSRALGRTAQATAALERAHELRPSASTSYRLGRAHLRRGDCSAAISRQQSLIERWPDSPRQRLWLGNFYRRCGQPNRALKAYQQASLLNPGWGRPYRQTGLLHYEAGRLKQALASFREALKRNPDDSNLWDRITALSPDRDPILDRYQPSGRAIAKAIIAGRRKKAMPGASIVWLMDDEVTRVMPDGTVKRLVTTVRMAADRGGRDRLGQARLPRRGLVKVLDAFAIDRRGRRREVTSMHGRTVRYPKLEEGAIVVLRYLHVRQPSGYLRQHFAASWYFQNPLGQIENARWILAVPAERKLNMYVHGKVAHVKRRSNGLTIHRFSARAVPPLRPERRSLPVRDLMRSVTVSTVPTWEYFSSWGRALTSEVFEMTPELKDKLQQLVKGATGVSDKIQRGLSLRGDTHPLPAGLRDVHRWRQAAYGLDGARARLR